MCALSFPILHIILYEIKYHMLADRRDTQNKNEEKKFHSSNSNGVSLCVDLLGGCVSAVFQLVRSLARSCDRTIRLFVA